MDGFNPEHRERPKGVNLRVVKPQGDKHHMVGFDAKTLEEVEAYNEAIAHHLGSLKEMIFHQVGGSGEVGYHAWEIWDTNVNEQNLSALLPVIERDAQVIMTEKDFDVLYEQVYKRWSEEEKR